jgi:Poly(A) polymerase predicted RNA binding domain
MNSSANVSRHTLAVMKKELGAAYEVCKGITATINEQGHMFEPSDFFLAYNHYLVLNIIGNDSGTESRGWIGFVESRIRTFLNAMEGLPLSLIHLYPQGSKTAKAMHAVCYFIGFEIDFTRLRTDKTIDFHSAVARFKANGVNGLFDKFNKGLRIEGLDFVVEHVLWKQVRVQCAPLLKLLYDQNHYYNYY